MLSNKYDPAPMYEDDEEETYVHRNTDYYDVTLEEGEDPFADDYMMDDEEEFDSQQLSDDSDSAKIYLRKIYDVYFRRQKRH